MSDFPEKRLPQRDLNTLLQFFKALANESRLKLVGAIAQQERSVEELASILDLKEPTVSHHLSKLKELQLVNMRADGNTHYYRLDLDALQEMQKATLTATQAAQPVKEEVWETKVLNTFVENDLIKEIPSSRKKRRIILKWLVQKFEFDRLYPEQELNGIIKPIHWDTATLRREMVGYNLMQRENSVYQRIPESEWRIDANY
jgi:DNA-binding MarR family transcriptional regulator